MTHKPFITAYGRDGRDFSFVLIGSRYVLDGVEHAVIHIVKDATRAGKARPWEVIRKTDGEWSGLGQSRYKTPENAARAAVEFWGL